MENLNNNISDASRCQDGDHAFQHEYIDDIHVFTCASCGYSVLPKTIVNNQPFIPS